MREFRYIKFQIDAIHDGSIMQVGDIRFLDNEGNTYSFPNTISATSNIASASDNESPSMLFDGDASTKWCSAVFTNGAYVILDLGDGQTIDVDTYNQWCWYTANDTALNPNRNPKSFSLWGSVNGIDYTLLDKVDYLESLVASESLAYTGNIVRDSLDGYSILDYIESDGTQYIDTGFKPTLKTKLYADFEIITTGNDQGIMGVVDDNCCLVYNQTNIYGSFKAGTGASVTVDASSTYYDRHTVSIENGVFTLDGVEHTFTALSSYSSDKSVYIFALNYDSAYGMTGLRMYASKIYDNGTLVRDLVPAKNNEGVCGLYDKVNDVFYASATSTNFTGVVMGSNGMPLGYTVCEYIESDGTNYIDTGFAPNQDTRVVMDAKLLSTTGWKALFGAWTLSGASYINSFAFVSNGTVFRDSYASEHTLFPSTASINERVVIDKSLNTCTLSSGESVTHTSVDFTQSNAIYLCANNTDGTATELSACRIYSCKIYDNGTLIRDYIPCQTNDGVYGLWDDVNKEFVAEVKQEAVAPTYTWSTVEGITSYSAYSSAVDGVRRNIYGNGDSSASRARCTFKGVTSITFNCMYSGESNYDYLTIGNLDSTCTRSTYGTSLRGTSGTAKDITFNCTEDEHYVEFCYSKDSSYDEGDDCGYVYIKSVVAVTVADSNPFTGKWAENKELKISVQEFRHRLMATFGANVNYVPDYIMWFDGKSNLQGGSFDVSSDKWYPKSPHSEVSNTYLNILPLSYFTSSGSLYVGYSDGEHQTGASDYDEDYNVDNNFYGPIHALNSLGYNLSSNGGGMTIEIIANTYSSGESENYYFGRTYALTASERGGLQIDRDSNQMLYKFNDGSNWNDYYLSHQRPSGTTVITLCLNSTNQLILYINGEKISTTNVVSTFNFNAESSEPFSIGSYDSTDLRCNPGYYYSFKLYNRPLNDDEVNRNFEFANKYYNLGIAQ